MNTFFFFLFINWLEKDIYLELNKLTQDSSTQMCCISLPFRCGRILSQLVSAVVR